MLVNGAGARASRLLPSCPGSEIFPIKMFSATSQGNSPQATVLGKIPVARISGQAVDGASARGDLRYAPQNISLGAASGDDSLM
ncbi:MAG: hypothetical protein WBG23_04325 [Acidobacteriaceae bacterium]